MSDFVVAKTPEDIERNRAAGAHEFKAFKGRNDCCAECGGHAAFWAHEERYRVIGAPAPMYWD